jgi:uncharacterized membrane protein YqgA involved in biofilm formation
MRGTFLNTATVALGGAIGFFVGKHVPPSYNDVALHGIGLVTCGFGIKMFLKSHNALVAAISVAVGGIIGLALGIDAGIGQLSEWARHQVGGDAGHFNEGLITTFVLFCVGPMTLLGCIKDGLEGDIEILALKSTMDGISAFFFAAAMGAGVLVTALLLLLFQGALTLLARPLKPLVQNEWLIDELTASGGAILFGIALGLLGLANLHTANYLPALVLAPLVALGFKRMENAKVKA